MKEAFLKDMLVQYPQGLNPITEKHQWRDLIRAFAMGWCDALMSVNARDKVAEWVEEFRPLSDHNWWPDMTWAWWL